MIMADTTESTPHTHITRGTLNCPDSPSSCSVPVSPTIRGAQIPSPVSPVEETEKEDFSSNKKSFVDNSATTVIVNNNVTTTTSTGTYRRHLRTMAWASSPVLALWAAVQLQSLLNPAGVTVQAQNSSSIPAQAQIIDQKSFNVWPTDVPPSTVANGTQIFMPPGISPDDLLAKPFHIYNEEFLSVIGDHPTLTLIAETETNPLYHEAVVWYEPTNEAFFVQNAGAVAAGTGLNKSAIIQKISVSEADAVKNLTNATGQVTVTTVPSNPTIINPNGATNFRGQLAYLAEGAGDYNTSQVVLMNPREPYNTTVLVNNYFGRQFSSLNDAVVHPVNKDLYFTDTLYGYLQDFRPAPGLRNQVYRWNDTTGAVTVAADGFVLPNGVTFSPDGKYAYVTDTGINEGFWGYNFSNPASIYRFDVKDDGTWDNRKTFAFIDSGVPDGVHCDAAGNVYAGCGDGVHVWNSAGTLIGKIYLGTTSANFQFTGDGRLLICAETKLFYATVAAKGDYAAGQM